MSLQPLRLLRWIVEIYVVLFCGLACCQFSDLKVKGIANIIFYFRLLLSYTFFKVIPNDTFQEN
jgi:hypothetical protein